MPLIRPQNQRTKDSITKAHASVLPRTQQAEHRRRVLDALESNEFTVWNKSYAELARPSDSTDIGKLEFRDRCIVGAEVKDNPVLVLALHSLDPHRFQPSAFAEL